MQPHQIDLGTILLVAQNGGELHREVLGASGVALDGALQGPLMGTDARTRPSEAACNPEVGPADDVWSFDHHAGCVRMITYATCEQVRVATCLGFDWRDRTVFINDLDADTVLSVWEILHADRLREPTVAWLVRSVGTIDAHGPAGYQLLGETDVLYAKALFGALDGILGRDVQARFSEWPAMLEAALAAVDAVLDGTAQPPPPEEVVLEDLQTAEVEGVRIAMASCGSWGGFEKLYRDGHRVVCLHSLAADGSLRYTVGKLSDLVPYPLGPADRPGTLLHALAEREAGWGGSSSIGGSPRLEGGVSSWLTPAEVWGELVDAAWS